MPVFDTPEISELLSELDNKVRKRFHEIAKVCAEDIAKELFSKYGKDSVCMDIDSAIESAEDWIHESADSRIIYDYDNEILHLVSPYPEVDEVEEDLVDYAAKDGLKHGIAEYAYQLWTAAIKNELKKVLKKMCG